MRSDFLLQFHRAKLNLIELSASGNRGGYTYAS